MCAEPSRGFAALRRGGLASDPQCHCRSTTATMPATTCSKARQKAIPSTNTPLASPEPPQNARHSPTWEIGDAKSNLGVRWVIREKPCPLSAKLHLKITLL